MKLSIVDHLVGSVRLYQQNFKTLWKYLWLPILLGLSGSILTVKDLMLGTMLTGLTGQTHTPLSMMVWSVALTLLSSLLMTRTLVPLMRGVSPSGFWGFPWGKKDLQLILRSIGVFLIVIGICVALGALLGFAIGLGVGIAGLSYDSFMKNVVVIIISVVSCTILIRYFFYPMSIYGETPLTFRESWRLVNKNTIKVGTSIGLSYVILAAPLMIPYSYYLYPIFYAICMPVSSIFFVAIYLTLSKQQSMVVLKK
jgi:hypothetical protein